MVDQYFAYSLTAAHRAVHGAMTARAREFGIQVEAWRVLEALDTDARLTMGQLAELVLMNPSALSKLVDRMVADGLVHRQISREDQRQINLLLTALGRKRMAQIREAAQEQDRSIRAHLGDGNAAILKDMLVKLRSLYD